MENRPNWFDWLVYRFFRWWWNPIFNAKPEMAKGFHKLIGMHLKNTNDEVVTVPSPTWWH
jgi:hypothetical protein